jgi:hypothetical protein
MLHYHSIHSNLSIIDRMKKFWFSLVLLSFSGSLFSQVKFNLTYQLETQTYIVSVIPETNYPEPKNMIGSAQIVLRAKFSENFTPVITSLVEGLVWADNAYVDYPVESPEYTFVCIALANGPTKKIQFSTDKEVALFSFKNANGDCPGRIELISNEDEMVQTVRTSGYNVTQNLGVLGARGNAYAGVLNGTIECSVTGTKMTNDRILGDILIAPVPADKRITISWENQQDVKQRIEMVIMDSKAREVYREKVDGIKGENSLNVDVSSWASGVYTVRFQFDSGGQTRGWHFMVMR